MLRENRVKQDSFYSTLYEKTPEIHILKQIDKAVNFCNLKYFISGGETIKKDFSDFFNQLIEKGMLIKGETN